jgi:AcrR family transcriptional regulator
VVAHPGHELRIHGWLEKVRPVVFVLTDGSGRGAPRLESTTRLLAKAGATPGSIYGRFSDREIYSALLAGETDRFVELAAELATALREAGIQTVAGDALEGFNPGHDLCRLLIDAAVARLAREGRPLLNLQFPLEEHPAGDGLGNPLDLDDEAFARKLAAARAYPEMAGEVEAALARFGSAAFRQEHLTPAVSLPIAALYEEKPFFERHGERRVAEGHYREVLRGRQHLVPIAAALERWA